MEVYVDPERGAHVRGPLLARQLQRVAERAAERSLPALTVRCAVFEPERDWQRILTDAGFSLAKRYVRMHRSLADLPAEPPPPPGVTVRPVRPDDERDLRDFHRIFDTAFRDTPDYEPLGYAEWRKKITQHGTTWDEWFVAEVDGVAAGALQSSDQALDQNEGFVRSLSVLLAYRRRGGRRAAAPGLHPVRREGPDLGRPGGGSHQPDDPAVALPFRRPPGDPLDRHVRTRGPGRGVGCVMDDPGGGRRAAGPGPGADWACAIRATPTRCRWGGTAAR